MASVFVSNFKSNLFIVWNGSGVGCRLGMLGPPSTFYPGLRDVLGVFLLGVSSNGREDPSHN